MASMIREWKSFDEANITVESVMNPQGVKECYMRGIFIQADQRNLNERVYPRYGNDCATCFVFCSSKLPYILKLY